MDGKRKVSPKPKGKKAAAAVSPGGVRGGQRKGDRGARKSRKAREANRDNRQGGTKRGRPTKYGKIDLKQVEKLASLGLIDTEIALVLRISERTLNYYKKRKDFLQSIKKGKLVADKKVIESLYKRATGYEYKEIHKEYRKKKDKKGKEKKSLVLTSETKKQVAPDPTSCIFWMINRMPKKWKNTQNFKHSGKVTHEHQLSMTELKKSLKGYKNAGD